MGSVTSPAHRAHFRSPHLLQLPTKNIKRPLPEEAGKISLSLSLLKNCMGGERLRESMRERREKKSPTQLSLNAKNVAAAHVSAFSIEKTSDNKLRLKSRMKKQNNIFWKESKSKGNRDFCFEKKTQRRSFLFFSFDLHTKL